MGTFFDKVTSPYQNPPELPAPEEERPTPAPKRGRKPKAQVEPQQNQELSIDQEFKKPMPFQKDLTHVKIESDDASAREPAEAREEDGELTVDIYDNGDAIMIQSTVAGVKPEDLDISITTDSVTIRGKRKQQEEIREEDYYYKELFWGAFSRSIILPEEIEEGEAEAKLKHGLLSIRLPKKKRNIVQKLKVKVT